MPKRRIHYRSAMKLRIGDARRRIHYRFAMKIRSVTENRHNFDTCKDIENDPPKHIKNMQQFRIQSQRYCDLGVPKEKKYHWIIIKSSQIGTKLPEPLWSLNKSAHRAHTLHACSSRKRLSKSKAENTSLSRDRLQSIPLSGHDLDFRFGLQ